MKASRKDIIAMFIIGLLSLSACNQDIHKPTAMTRAEKIMDENPDSARHLLETLKPNMAKENKATQMYYNLLTVKANDKCYIPHTSDSLMLEVVKYYEHHGEPQQLIQAYYYLASVYRDLNFTAQALEYFNKALNIPDKDCNLYKARAANQIGHIYMYQDIYKEALPYFEKTYQYAKLIPDTTLMVYALRDEGRSYQAQEKTQEAIRSLNSAAVIANQSKNRQLQNQIFAELSISYENAHDYLRAKQTEDKCGLFKQDEDYSAHFIRKGNIFLNLNQKDSAIFCYKQVLNSSYIYSKQEANFHLYDIYLKQGNYQKACNYLYNCLLSTDSIKNQNIVNNSSLIKELNQKMYIEKENSKLKETALKQRIVIILAFALIIILSLSTAIYVKSRQLKAREQKKRINRILASQKKNSEETIQANTRKIKELKESLASSNQHVDDLELQVLLLEKEQLQSQNKEIEIECKKRVIDREKLEQTEIYKRFKLMTTSGKPTRSDYRELEVTLNQLFDNFTFRLKKLYPYWSNNDIKLCLLIKIGLNPKEIKNITGNTDSNISMIRKRLLKKILGKDDKPKVFDQFIKDL